MGGQKTREYLNLIFGSFLTAVGVAYFVNPGKIASGGVSGVATMLFHTLGWNPGVVIFVLSVPLFLCGMKVFGKAYGFKSLLGTILLSGFTAILVKVSGGNGFLDYSDSLSSWLSALFGGVIMGAGMGFVMKGGANTGGTDIVAQILSKYTPLSLGTSLTLVDAIIIVASAFVFGVESAMYAIITVYITGITIDKVVLSMGTNAAKTVFIITSKIEEISHVILDELGHGGTILPGLGMYTGKEKSVIMTVVSNQKISLLTARVKAIDDRAFMIVHQAYQVLGEGFTPIAKVAGLSYDMKKK